MLVSQATGEKAASDLLVGASRLQSEVKSGFCRTLGSSQGVASSHSSSSWTEGRNGLDFWRRLPDGQETVCASGHPKGRAGDLDSGPSPALTHRASFLLKMVVQATILLKSQFLGTKLSE